MIFIHLGVGGKLMLARVKDRRDGNSRQSAISLDFGVTGLVHRASRIREYSASPRSSMSGELESDRIAEARLPRADIYVDAAGRPGGKNNKIARVKTGSQSPGGPLSETQNYQNYRRGARARRRANGALRSGVFLREIVFLPRIKMRAASIRFA